MILNYNPVIRHCKCGHSIGFLKRTPKICNYCGKIVYPDEKYEFEEKIKKLIKKQMNREFENNMKE